MDITSIDTRIGTQSNYEFSHGNTLPLTGEPFSMNYLSVQTTSSKNSWWFNPEDHTFAGIKLTHQPSPWIGDFQTFLFRFKTRDINNLTQIDDYLPTKAIFRPDLISVNIVNQEIKVRATSNKLGGVLDIYNFSTNSLKLIIQGKKLKKLKNSNSYFVFKTQNFTEAEDSSFSMWTAISGSELIFEKEITDNNETALIFSLPKHAQIKFATSFISSDQAIFNLSNQKDFYNTQNNTQNNWNNIFKKIEIEDSQIPKVKTFYENLYRSFLFPMQFYEVTPHKKAVHYSTALKKVTTGKMFTNVGFWDVYRSSFPLFSLLYPKLYSDFLEGFFNHYQETGFLPRWLSPDERGMMPGTMLDVLIADAVTKNISLPHLKEYYAALVKGAETSSKNTKYGREGLEDYKQLGYVSTDYPESVNKTLDYAYSDWAISIIAQKLHHLHDAKYYAKRSLNYQNLFDKDTGLMRPKNKDGKFMNNFKPQNWGEGFTEGGAWQNSFNVYQDIPGLIKLYGSKQKFVKQLIKLVNQSPLYHQGSYGQTIHEMREMAAQPFGQLAISNQPSFHLCYLFALAGYPHYTELLVRQLLTSFSSGFKAYPGDEDNGSMSAWYLWSTLGLYPQAPGTGKYVFGIPSFDYVKINLPNKKSLTLLSENNDPTHQFVQNRYFNTKELSSEEISHQELMDGGLLKTKLSLLPE